MKINQWVAVVVAAGAWVLGGGSALGQCGETPPTLVIDAGLPGEPPAIIVPEDEMVPAGAQDFQFEFWKVGKTGSSSLFARVWSGNDFWGKAFDKQYVWNDIEDYRRLFLRGTGPGKWRTFPVGAYRVRWRGWWDCGWGPWSEITEIDVEPIEMTPPTITEETDGLVGPTDDLAWEWDNHFAPSKYKIEIRRGTKVVRKKTLDGAFGRPYGYMRFSSYRDRPKSPNQELPKGTGYVFKVGAFSPVTKKWSAWSAAEPFSIDRGAPVLPDLVFSQEDYGGNFNASPRPYFSADYENTGQTALWTYFDIRKKVGGKLQVVRKQWLSRYGELGDENLTQLAIGGGFGYWGTCWKKDLPAGEYLWMVQAWNGKGTGESAWTDARIDLVVAAGPLAKPAPPTDFFNWSGKTIRWLAVPNAYSYQIKMLRNGSPYRTSPTLDAAQKSTRAFDFSLNKIWAEDPFGEWYDTGDLEASWWSTGRLPSGRYTFQVRALNKTNPAGQQESPWSDPSAEFVVP